MAGDNAGVLKRLKTLISLYNGVRYVSPLGAARLAVARWWRSERRAAAAAETET